MSASFNFDTPVYENTSLVGNWHCPLPDPEPGVHDLVNLERAMDTDDPESYFPIGTEIPDTWNGTNEPLIVGAYNVERIDGENYVKVGLMRKYVTATRQWGSSSSTYANSSIYSYLNNEYYSLCSDELKAVIDDVAVPWLTSSGTMTYVPGKVHLLSEVEAFAEGSPGGGEGMAWQYFYRNASTDYPTNSGMAVPNRWRTNSTTTSTYRNWWTRTQSSSSSSAWYISSQGSGSSSYSKTSSCYVLPVFWIVSKRPIAQNSISDVKAAVNAGKDGWIGAEIPDTWDGVDAPLIIGHNTTINGKKAIGLFRKYPYPTRGIGNSLYPSSSLVTYFKGDYLNACSAELRANISTTPAIWYSNTTSSQTVNAPWHLFSTYEIMLDRSVPEGQIWQYWSYTGGWIPNGRNPWAVIARNSSGSAVNWWTRTRYYNVNSYMMYVTTSGESNISSPGSYLGIRPYCYILAD